MKSHYKCEINVSKYSSLFHRLLYSLKFAQFERKEEFKYYISTLCALVVEDKLPDDAREEC